MVFFIARRYFFSKKSQRVINLVSLISLLGVLVGSAALIIVLSVFNGFESLVISLYNSFDPELKITASQGKTFVPDSVAVHQLRKMSGVKSVSLALEENALVKYHEKQSIIAMKGVDEQFAAVSGVDSMMAEGRYVLQEGDVDYAIVGGGIAYNLQLNPGDLLSQLDIYVPRRSATSMTFPEESFNRRFIIPAGVFSIQQEFDGKYILVPMRFAREMLEEEDAVSSIEVLLQPGADADKVRDEVKQLMGAGFSVQTRLEQHELLYHIMKSEKWAVFLILTFILLIATFNMVGSLTMLIIEKQKDITVLYSMGADASLIRKIFFAEGMMLTLAGAAAGIVLGAAVCFMQQQFGLVRLSGSGSFIIDAYPVKMQAADFIYVLLTVSAIGFGASIYPARKLAARKINPGLVRADE